MAEQHKFPDDEYQFTEIESSEAFGTVETAEQKPPTQNVKRRIFIAIGVIVLILIVYKLWSIFFESKQMKQPLVTTPPVTLPEPKPQPPIEKPEAALSADAARSLSQVQQQETENVRTINSLQSQVSDLKTSLNAAEQKVKTLESSIQ